MREKIMMAFSEKQAIEEKMDFKFKTTFWEEFSIAETYGSAGIQEHYDIAFAQWKDNLLYLTELVLVLNLKMFMWFQVDDAIGQTYERLWMYADAYALETLKGEDLHYYLSTLD